jgi:hypothetical protein
MEDERETDYLNAYACNHKTIAPCWQRKQNERSEYDSPSCRQQQKTQQFHSASSESGYARNTEILQSTRQSQKTIRIEDNTAIEESQHTRIADSLDQPALKLR